jgi:Fungal specific transcription factor domain
MINPQNVRLDQHRKRLFWSIYIFERKTALVLGRPFALSDEEIDLELPMNIDDNEDEERNLIVALDVEASSRRLEMTTLSYHRFLVELYQIHTEIRMTLHQLKKAQTKEQAQQRLTALFEQLENWRKQVVNTFDFHMQNKPRTPKSLSSNRGRALVDGEPGSSGDQGVHQRPFEVEKAELLLEYHKARRSLLQPLMTEGRSFFPFDTADYLACADASGQICQLYRRVHRLSPVPFSLRDLHAVFVAGFTLIYCICSCPSIYSAQLASNVGACSTVLYVITEQWSSAKEYRDAFEIVAEKMMDSARKHQENSAKGRLPYPDLRESRDDVNTTRISRGTVNNDSHLQSDATNSGQEDIEANIPSDNQTNLSHDPRSHSTPYSTTILAGTGDDDSFHGEDQVPTLTLGMELDLEFDLYDIEGLLSGEGLEWFTEAVL